MAKRFAGAGLTFKLSFGATVELSFEVSFRVVNFPWLSSTLVDILVSVIVDMLVDVFRFKRRGIGHVVEVDDEAPSVAQGPQRYKC